MDSGHPVVRISEENYKFRLSDYQQQVISWLEPQSGASATALEQPVYPSSRANEVLSFVRAGLYDISVSRRSDKVWWAIPVPGDAAHSVYVWVDALCNYLTMARPRGAAHDGAELSDDADWRDLFPAWPADVHIIGKDILRFHAVYWPALLMAAGLPPPHRIVAHGHWTVGRVKMSKSLGNVVSPLDLVAPRGPCSVDAARYFLLRRGSVSADSDFSLEELRRAAVSECADKFGNLASRVINPKLLAGGVLAGQEGVDAQNIARRLRDGEEAQLAERLLRLRELVSEAYALTETSAAAEAILDTLALGNRVFAAAEPWKLTTAGPDLIRLSDVMYLMLETLRVCCILLQPITPGVSAALLARLGFGAGSSGSGAVAVGGTPLAAGVAHPLATWHSAHFGGATKADYAVDVSSGPLILFAKAPKPPVAGPTS